MSGYLTALTSLHRDNYKYIRTSGGVELLFDLERDPGELHDLSGTAPDVLARLRGELIGWSDQP